MLFLAAAAVLFRAVLIPFCRSVNEKKKENRATPTLHFLFDFEKSLLWTLALNILKSLLTFIEKFGFLLSPSLDDWNLLVSRTAYVPLMMLGTC